MATLSGVASEQRVRSRASSTVLSKQLRKLIAVGTISTTLEPKPVQPPFEITRGERYEGRWTRVGVLPAGTLDADAARSLALTGGVPESLGWSLAWIVGILAVFVPLSVWRYRRMS